MESYIGKSGTFALMKNLNLEKVFRMIVLKAPISRAEISRITGLNKVTVSNCVKTLLANDLVSEEGIQSSESGRPPVMLMLSKTFGVLIGVEVSAVSTNIVVTDLRGTILEKPIMEPHHYDPISFLDRIEGVVKECEEKYSSTTRGVVGVGVALPLNYNQEDSTIEGDPPLPEWKGFSAYDELKKRLGESMPVAVLTTAAAGAMGEIHFGDADPSTYLVYIHGSWSLKMDVYSGGETYSMSSGFIGQLGRTIIKKGDGDQGQLSQFASVKSMVNKLYEAPVDRYESVLDLMRRQKYGDDQVNAEMEQVVEYLAVGLHNVIDIFHPDKICIGSYLGLMLGRGWMDKLTERVMDLTHHYYPADERIITSKLGVYGVSFGCISWMRDHLIEFLFEEEEA